MILIACKFDEIGNAINTAICFHVLLIVRDLENCARIENNEGQLVENCR